MVFNCTLCGMGPRGTIFLVGLVSLVFAGGYVFFTTAGILAHNCQLNMTSSPEEYAIYLYYLRSSHCGPINLTRLGIGEVPADLPIDVPDVTAATERTYIFCIVGVALFGLWAITSVLMLGFACAPCMGRCSIIVGIYPFIIILFLVLAFDVVAFIFYLIDFIESFDLDFVLNLLEIGNQEVVRHLFEKVENIYLVVPPLILWLTASKGIIIWFIFLLLAFVMLGVGSRLWEENKPAPSYNNVVQAPRSMTLATAPVEMVEEPKPSDVGLTVAAVRYNDPARQSNDNMSYNEIQPPSFNVVRTVEPLKTGHEPLHEPPPPSQFYPGEPPSPLRTNSIINPYTDKRFSYLPGNPQPFSYLAGPPQLSPRNSTNVPEVRSQLPWTYFRNSEEFAMPKRVTSTLNEHKEFPGEEISPPMSKPTAPDDRSSDEGKWSGPEYRY